MLPVAYHPDVRKDLAALNQAIKNRIHKAIETRLTRSPEDYGKPLKGTLHGFWSLRVGDYRVIYRIQPPVVRVLQIAHRRDAYGHGMIEGRRRGWLA